MTRADGAAQAPTLSLSDLDYDLPPDLVAQTPADPRDTSRLLVHRGGGISDDRSFRDLPGLLRAGDVLVRNDTRVFPARSHFRRATGGRLEVLFLRPAVATADDSPAVGGDGTPEVWEALVRGRPRRGEVLLSERLAGGWPLTAVRPLGDGRWRVASPTGCPVLDMLGRAGATPLPPYIHEPLADPERYQTTYARAVGSAAAPTAGLHFTAGLDAALLAAGVQIETLTLHVGLGTFKPLSEDGLTAGRLHSEVFEIDAGLWARLLAARSEGRRVIAVGTTSLRTLEHLARRGPEAPVAGPESPPAGSGGAPHVLRGETDLFIAPGFEFRAVDGLLTNFHLPRTSLLALVMAFCGVEQTRRLYEHAVTQRYRFYSFGDAMLAL